MSKARLIITAVVVEGRSPSEVARTYGVARSWVYTLVARYRAAGNAAFEPRSRRPRTRPDSTPTATVKQKNSRPNHPTTCGKVERFQQTLKRWLARQPAATTLPELQPQLDTFTAIYNQQRPHRSLPHRTTPTVAYLARPKATPANNEPDPEFRVRHDRINNGRVSLRVDGHMHHIGLGRTLDRTRVIVLITGYNARVIHATTGEMLRALTLDPERRYHGTGAPIGGPRRPYGPRKKNQSEP